MRLVHIEPVHAQLLKGHYVIPHRGILELFQPGFQALACPFQRFDAEILSPVGFQLVYAVQHFVDLILEQHFLALPGDRKPLKLTVADDHRVVIPGSDPGTEFLAIVLFKILFRRDQDVCRGI